MLFINSKIKIRSINLILLDDISFDSSDDIYQSTKSVLEGTFDYIQNFMILQHQIEDI